MNSRRKWLVVFSLVALAASVVLAQRRGGFRGPSSSRGEVPEWSNEPGFEKDVFTFVRIQYDSGYDGRGWGRGGGGGWRTDYRDADLNFSFRLQQLTSLKVDPEGKILRLTDPDLFNYPVIYIVEPGRLEFSDEEVKTLQRYLLSGGFLMVDDFWGEAEYENFYEEIKRVFPGREPQELPLEHPIFHCVFDLKEKPQIPNFQTGEESQYNGGITWERSDARTPHYRAIFDDKGRMMVIICHNTDNGDGWEREGEYEYYFREFSEKKAYPLGINIVFYAMTH
jgi:Domain of unknown function (DUF4159)